MNKQYDEQIWDKGTPFESGADLKKPQEREDDIVWDRGTPFESRERKSTTNENVVK